MDGKYIIKCKGKEEFECIKNGLDAYRMQLMNQINSFGTSDSLIDDYSKTLELVNKMIEGFY
jgi:hypothetical protein